MNTQMKQLYSNLLVKLNSAKGEADNILDNYKMSDKESEAYSDELKVYLYIQNQLKEELEDSIYMIENSLKESIESYLIYDPESRRYKLAHWSEGNTLSCGYPIEVLNDKWELDKDEFRWYSGRVEYSDDYGGYYFFNKEGKHISLEEGMRVRVRRK